MAINTNELLNIKAFVYTFSLHEYNVKIINFYILQNI